MGEDGRCPRYLALDILHIKLRGRGEPFLISPAESMVGSVARRLIFLTMHASTHVRRVCSTWGCCTHARLACVMPAALRLCPQNVQLRLTLACSCSPIKIYEH